MNRAARYCHAAARGGQVLLPKELMCEVGTASAPTLYFVWMQGACGFGAFGRSVSSCVKQYKLALQGALDCKLHVRFSRAVGFLVGSNPRGYRHQTYSSGSPVTGAARIYHMGICCCSGRRLARATILNTLVINHFWELTQLESSLWIGLQKQVDSKCL